MSDVQLAATLCKQLDDCASGTGQYSHMTFCKQLDDCASSTGQFTPI